jgi:hypothetical protein
MTIEDLVQELPPIELGLWGGLGVGVSFLGLGIVALLTRHKLVGVIALLVCGFGFYQLALALSVPGGQA